MVRAFIAVEVRADRRLASLLEELKKQSVRLKAVEAGNIHLTLKFLGEIDDEQVKRISEDMAFLGDIWVFSVFMNGIGAFPSVKRPRVIWIGINESGTLRRIWAEIEDISERAGIKRDIQDFSPHITLARVKDFKNSWKVGDFIEKHREDSFGELPIEEIKLKKSVLTRQGPIYSDILTVKLKK